MSSGEKRIQLNTRERVVSNDHNRLQAFIAADISAFNRRMFQDQYLMYTSCGYAFEQHAIAAPLAADVIGGLMVVPVIGSTDVLVTPGELGCYYPDATPDPDDDPYKTLFSPGVDTYGTLVIAANASGSARIDVIECQPIELVEEQDNRDIFDPASGTFSPQLVDKVVAGRLQYRVRQGTPGAGYPAAIAGWLPLAVASVPSGSTSNNSVTFWDVRPLVVERAVQPFHAGSLFAPVRRRYVIANKWTTPGQMRISGSVDFDFGYYKACGTLAKGTPTATMGTGDVPYIDAMNSENVEPGFTAVAGALWYVYAVFPFGLPRWVRYTESDIAGLGRLPGPMRGIGVVSNKPPVLWGAPTGGIALPTSTGLGGGAIDSARMVTASVVDGTGVLDSFASDGRMIYPTTAQVITPLSSTSAYENYQLVSGASLPLGARRVRIGFLAQFTATTGVAYNIARSVNVQRYGFTDVVTTVSQGSNNGVGTGGAFYDYFEVDVPILSIWPLIYMPAFNLQVAYSPSGATKTGSPFSMARIVGWEFGP